MAALSLWCKFGEYVNYMCQYSMVGPAQKADFGRAHERAADVCSSSLLNSGKCWPATFDESTSVCALSAIPNIGRLCPLAFKLTQTGCVEAFREALVAWVRFKRQRRMNACKVCNTAVASWGNEGSCRARYVLLTRGCGCSGHYQCRGADQERAGIRRVRCGPARHHVRDPMCVFSSIGIKNLRHCVYSSRQ
jgi:hypothetical protein